MKSKVIAIVFFIFGFINCFGQTIFNKNVNDTISIEKLGKKIELETNLALAEKWNDEIISILKQRKDLNNLHPKVKYYYQSTYLISLLSKAYFEQEKGNVKKSITINLSILKIADKSKDKKIIGFTCLAIGNSFAVLEEYENAKKYYLKTVELVKKLNDKTILANLYGNLAFVSRELNDKKVATEYIQKSLEIRRKLNIPGDIANCLMAIGKDYFDQNDLINAEKYYQEAIVYCLKVKDENQMATCYFNLYNIKTKLNDKKSAFQYLLKANELSRKTKKLNIISESSKQLYLYYIALNQSDKALKYFEQSIEAEKTLNKEENKSTVLKAEFKYETEKKEAQIKSLSQQKKIANLESQRQKNIALILAIAIISILITSYVLFNRYKIKKQNELLKSQLIEAEKTIEAEKKATESELKALKSQMNPHFIFNALSSIQDQFMFGDKVIANEQMGNFTYLTRQILNVSGKKQILLSTEIDLLTKYLELEKMRFNTDFEYQINLHGNIDEDYHEIPPMLVQPFVENSIKHGLLHKDGLKKIEIIFDLDATEEFIICSVTDNGIGRQKSAEIKAKNHSNHTSFSTQSIEQRLELLNEKLQLTDLISYSDLVSLENEIIGTKVVIKIPIV